MKVTLGFGGEFTQFKNRWTGVIATVLGFFDGPPQVNNRREQVCV